jgi:hypothetical protein
MKDMVEYILRKNYAHDEEKLKAVGSTLLMFQSEIIAAIREQVDRNIRVISELVNSVPKMSSTMLELVSIADKALGDAFAQTVGTRDTELKLRFETTVYHIHALKKKLEGEVN